LAESVEEHASHFDIGIFIEKALSLETEWAEERKCDFLFQRFIKKLLEVSDIILYLLPIEFRAAAAMNCFVIKIQRHGGVVSLSQVFGMRQFVLVLV